MLPNLTPTLQFLVSSLLAQDDAALCARMELMDALGIAGHA